MSDYFSRRFANLSAILFSSLLAACGGGGGGGDSPEVVASTETFQIRQAWITNVQTAESRSVTYSGTFQGRPLSGSGRVTSGSPTATTFEGQSAYAVVSTVTATIRIDGTDYPLSSSGTSYFGLDYLPLGNSVDDYQVFTSSTIPMTARVNDTFIAYTGNIYPNSAKAYRTGTVTGTVVLEPDTASTALLKLIEDERNLSGTLVSQSISVYRITPQGGTTPLYSTAIEGDLVLRVNY